MNIMLFFLILGMMAPEIYLNNEWKVSRIPLFWAFLVQKTKSAKNCRGGFAYTYLYRQFMTCFLFFELFLLKQGLWGVNLSNLGVKMEN